MSIKFSAGLNITGAAALGNGVWRVYGDIHDSYLTSYTAADVQVGYIIIDESTYYGTCNRWKITVIDSAVGQTLVCQVIWDDEGTEDILGPAIGVAGVCYVSQIKKIGEIPLLETSGISQNLQTRILNINNRQSIDSEIRIQNYFANTTIGQEVQVRATGLGITATIEDNRVIFSIPSDVTMLSATIRTVVGLSILIIDTGFKATTVEQRFPPNCHAWREDTGTLQPITSTISLIPYDGYYDRIIINGLNTSQKNLIKLSF